MSAVLPLLVTVPLCLVVAGRGLRRATLFLAGMIPAVAAWQIWVATHLSHAPDLVTLYYTDYAAYQRYNVPLADLPLVIWYNLDGLLQGIGPVQTLDLEPSVSNHRPPLVPSAALA